MRHISARLRGVGGVTFTEVAVTLSLLSVLMVATTPVFSKLLAQFHLRGATQEMFSELQRTRLQAVMENNRYRVYVVGNSPVYRVHDDKNRNSAEDEGEVSTRTLEVDNPGIVLSGTNTVTFLPNGTALTYGTIMLTNGSGDSKSVVVSSGGRIQIR